jgi:ribonuclease BN (tRNA processing enzyme)
MQLYLISAGTPTPTESRFGTCYVLHVGQDHLMFDCGPAATHKLVKAGLFPTLVDYLFFTHHHYDHNVDYPCFLLTRWNHQTGKENRLRIWGPPPIQRITEQLIGEGGAFSDDWTARVNHPGSQDVHVERGGTLPRPKPTFDVSEIEPGAEIAGNGWQVTTALAQHQQPWLQSLAYRVDSEEGSIVITGDAQPNKPLGELARGVSTLVVNCWDHQSRVDARTSIAGTLDAAQMAHDAGAERLVLSHSLARLTRPGSKEKGISDIARVFDGEIIFGEELMCLEL